MSDGNSQKQKARKKIKIIAPELKFSGYRAEVPGGTGNADRSIVDHSGVVDCALN